MVVLGLACAGAAFAQASPAQHSSPRAAEKHSTPAEAELAKRINVANAARSSGDAAAVAVANKNLIALALREMAQLRLLESAYPQAVELYRKSLEFEAAPDVWIDLAIADFDAGELDESIKESQEALTADSNSARAYTIMGRTFMRKHEYGKAADALAHAAGLKPDVESLYSLAVCLLATRDPRDKQKAAGVFQQMIAIADDGGSLHVLFGRAYRDADDLPSAVEEFKRAIALDPRTPHAHYFLGLSYLSLNEWKPTPEAKAELQKELQYYPHDFLANYMVGFLAAGERQYDVSDKYLTIAAEINPTWPEPFLYMGLNAYAQGDMKRAEEMLRKAVVLTGTDEARSNYQIRRAYVDLGRILETSGRKEEAETFLAKARDLQNKTMQQTQQSVSEMVLAGGAGSAAAIVPLTRQTENEATPLLPNTDPFAHIDASALAHSNLTEQQRALADAQEKTLRAVLGLSFNDLATSEAVRGEFSSALNHYQEAERWDGSTPGLARNLGMCAFKVANYPEAVRGLSQALAEKPDAASVRAMLGMSYFALDKYADAAKTFAPLGERGMQDPAVGYAWAASLARTGDLKQASAVLAEFENNNLPSDTLLLVGQLWIEIGDYDRAVAVLRRTLQSNASLPKAHYYAGLAHLRAERWPEAAEEFKAELMLVPNDPDAKYNLGFVYLQQSRTDDAVALFQEVTAARPDYANAHYELGKILLDRGMVKDAIVELETAARLSPQTDYVHYQLQSAYRKDARMADADRELQVYKELKAKSRANAAAPSQNP